MDTLGRFSLTSTGVKYFGRLIRKVKYDPYGMVRLRGSEDEARDLLILDTIWKGDSFDKYLETPEVLGLVRSGIRGLFEAGYIEEDGN